MKNWTYAVREYKKTAGRSKAKTNPYPSSQLGGAKQVIKAYYDRSLEAAINGGYENSHPGFAGYAAALIRRWKAEGHPFPPGVMKTLLKKYPSKGVKLKPGGSSWKPGPGERGIRSVKDPGSFSLPSVQG